VVDNDDTAAMLMKRLEERNAGRVTFMPLNRLRVKHFTYPNSSDVVSLLKFAITFPREVSTISTANNITPAYQLFMSYPFSFFRVFGTQVERAMQQIFGGKLLARDLESATRFAEASDMDVVTPEGDEVNRKGSLQGGFHDEKSQKLAHVVTIREAREQVGAAQDFPFYYHMPSC